KDKSPRTDQKPKVDSSSTEVSKKPESVPEEKKPPNVDATPIKTPGPVKATPAKAVETPPTPKPAQTPPTLAAFQDKYRGPIDKAGPLNVEEKTLTLEQLKYLLKYRGQTLNLHLAELSPEFARWISKSTANRIAFSELRLLSPESMKNLGDFQGEELLFPKLDTLTLSTAPFLASLKVVGIVFDDFKTTPSAETIATVRAGLLNVRSTLKIKWPRETSKAIRYNMTEISRLIRSKLTELQSPKEPDGPGPRNPSNSGSRKAPPGPGQNRPRKAPSSPNQNRPKRPSNSRPPNAPPSSDSANSTIWNQIRSGKLDNISKLTELSPGIPSLLVMFAERQDWETLDLSGVLSLNPAYSNQLAKHKGRLILSSVTDVESSAITLSRFSGKLLDLSGLRSVSRVALQKLAQTKSTLVLGSRSPNLGTLKVLAAGRLLGLILKDLEVLEDDQARCLAASGIPYLGLSTKTLTPKLLDHFTDYRGILEFPETKTLAPEWIPILRRFKAKQVRFSGLRYFPDRTVRVLKGCTATERANIKKILIVPKKLQKKLDISLKKS
ncbi:MAG: hypothetical protein P1V97_08830, partial [Planctomycetota bacterium]|nr:hypothetical protein [Planctomycetota bacterium]